MKIYPSRKTSIRTAAKCAVYLTAVLGAATAPAATCPVDPATLADCPVVAADTTLTQNCKGPMKIVQGTVVVNLGGFAVMCSNENGIDIQNLGDIRIVNGSVSHNQQHGIQITEGVNIRLLNLDLIDNTGDGLNVVNSEQLVIKYVTSIDNFFGLHFIDTDRVKLAHSKATQNWEGVHIDQGIETVVKKSKINLNVTDGIGSSGRNNKFFHLKVNKNGDDGIDIDPLSRNVLIQFNKTNKNLDDGIDLDPGAAFSYVYDNSAFGNSEFDLNDNNANCADNTWLRNIFGTSNQSCIQ
jgi:Right handed beta helix region